MDIKSNRSIRKPPVCKKPPAKGPDGCNFILNLINVVPFGSGYEVNWTSTWDGTGSFSIKPVLHISSPRVVVTLPTRSDGATEAHQFANLAIVHGEQWQVWLEKQYWTSAVQIGVTP